MARSRELDVALTEAIVSAMDDSSRTPLARQDIESYLKSIGRKRKETACPTT
jgi:hypothetical protein